MRMSVHYHDYGRNINKQVRAQLKFHHFQSTLRKGFKKSTFEIPLSGSVKDRVDCGRTRVTSRRQDNITTVQQLRDRTRNIRPRRPYVGPVLTRRHRQAMVYNGVRNTGTGFAHSFNF